MNIVRAILPLSAAMLVAGCSSMSGLDAKDSFSCKAPDGVLCESMTGIYANAQQKNLPGQRVTHKASDSEFSRAKNSDAGGSGVLTKPIFSGTPIRSAPTILRVWFAPWEDTDGDLHDQSYVYLPVDNGRWLVEHNRRRIQDAYRPVRAPVAQAAPTVVGSSGGSLTTASGAVALGAGAGAGAGSLPGRIQVTPPNLLGEDAGEGNGQPPQFTQEMLGSILRNGGMPGAPGAAQSQTGDFNN